jgi:undecaprenyl pyrophosphate phosphatase UppP
MSLAQALFMGLLQGATELFPVSSLGHSVILPAFLGWTDVVAAQQASESYFLAFLVGLHVATALALALALLMYSFTRDVIQLERGGGAGSPAAKVRRPLIR